MKFYPLAPTSAIPKKKAILKPNYQHKSGTYGQIEPQVPFCMDWSGDAYAFLILAAARFLRKPSLIFREISAL